MQIAKQILSLIDLTSLNDNDNIDSIINLTKNATSTYGNVAAICIYSRFISSAQKLLQKTNPKIKIATVCNFPHGSDDVDQALYEVSLALKRGTDEIDIVFPYHELMQGKSKIGFDLINQAKKLCVNKTLKVIIESGILKTENLIELASRISIEAGSDFIKTSTGKVPINATLDAASIMLNTIKNNNSKCGFKASGGIKTVTDATKYLDLASQIMGSTWINSHTFRFGASGLLNDVMNILSNTNNIKTNLSY